MKNETEFSNWQKAVIDLMEEDGWNSAAIGTVDWIAWKDCYFNEGLSPEDAMLSEFEASFSGH